MKNKGITVIIVVLAIILAGLVGLLVYLEMGQREAIAPGASETQGTDAADTQAGLEDDPLATQAPAFTVETQGEDDATPMVPVQGVDEMDPNGATEGPEVDETLGAGETRDPDENELPIVG